MQKKSRSNVSLLSLLTALIMFLSACGQTGNSSNTEKAAENHQVLVSSSVGAGHSDIASFDPALVSDISSERAITPVFTGLVSLDDKGLVQAQMASGWQISDKGQTYTFTLKDGLTFSNGRTLAAADVAYSINRALDPATQSPVALGYLKMIKDSEMLGKGVSTLIGDSLIVQNDKTLQIKLNRPVGYFLGVLALPVASVVNPDLIQKYKKDWTDHLSEGAGAGPFKVKSYKRGGGKEIVLERNNSYYGPKPQLQEIHFPFYKEQDTTHADYLANRLDDTGIPLKLFPDEKKRKDYYQYSPLVTNYYAFNMRTKPFDNLKIRQAFALAINKDELSSKIWKGSYIPTNHIIPQGMPGYNPDLTGPDGTKNTSGNPTKAKQLFQEGMQEEGYQSIADIPAITLTYASGGNQATKDEVSLLEQDWQNVLGFTVKDVDVDINTLFRNTYSGDKNTLQFFAGPAWGADYPDPQDWTTLLFSKDSPQNGMHFGTNSSSENAAQEKLQQDMLAADIMPVDTDQHKAERLKAYQSIEQELVNQVTWLPTQQHLVYGLRKACVQGTPQPVTGLIPPDEWSKIYISKDADCVNKTVA
jgi:peptide/nickel transport system substrate-binding protein/oligopeptide transport system substrate-binding protein